MNSLEITNQDSEKLFWGATEISNYIGVSKSTAYHFMEKIKQTYDIDLSRCVYGKIPKSFVIDFFDQKVKKKN
ncbi:hypothetical protein [Faecalicoccus pleomorphus]|uniref:hypothetical protein n=1 Tax=Faecalicoccus pleomorphus TaxID=1323 RepID=UPI0025A3294B|nr:hypothetical protein [Faecalicoccus pleomorphus]MDM8293474.1 hypothetical protein [Faecalicoccus pleomorphus]